MYKVFELYYVVCICVYIYIYIYIYIVVIIIIIIIIIIIDIYIYIYIASPPGYRNNGGNGFGWAANDIDKCFCWVANGNYVASVYVKYNCSR